MRWAIEIQKTQLDRRNLEDLLARLGYVAVQVESQVAISSAEIDRCGTASDVYEIGKRIREGFAGAAKIDKEFKLGAVLDYSVDPLRRHYFIEIQSVFHAHKVVFAPSLTINPPLGLSDDEMRLWEAQRVEDAYQAKLAEQLSVLVPAFFSPRATRVLDLLSIESPTGEVLFKIYELMRGGRESRTAFGKEFGISDEDYKRFSDTVHKDSVSGDWARHAHGEPASTDQPMTKEEAEAFVRRIAKAWLQHIRTVCVS